MKLEAIVADYLQQAATWNMIPAAGPSALVAGLGDHSRVTGHMHRDPVERPELTGRDLAIAALVGRSIERREQHKTPCVHDVLAAAAEVVSTQL